LNLLLSSLILGFSNSFDKVYQPYLELEVNL
jgi:hypothetical protein